MPSSQILWVEERSIGTPHTNKNTDSHIYTQVNLFDFLIQITADRNILKV
jgi:hypothetical protein